LVNRLGGVPSPAGMQPVGWVAVLVAAALAASPLVTGYFNFAVWAPLALGAMALLVAVLAGTRFALTRRETLACIGLGGMLVLSAASMLWADSRDSAWTETNRLALYGAIFVIALLTVRDRRTARVVVLLLGVAALLTSIVLAIVLLFGGGQDAFLGRRLNSPLEYINGTAGLLVMGIWPWIALGETARNRWVRAGAISAASMIGGTVVLTQSRAVLLAMLVSGALVLVCAPERTRRALNLLLVVASVALTLPWTLPVYSTGGADARLFAPSHGLLRAAAAAIVVSALAAAATRYALTRLSERAPPETVQQRLRLLGRVLVIGTLAAVCAGLALGGSRFSSEWHSFTALDGNDDASVRFTDASGYRYDLWRVAVLEFRAHPLDGVGAGNYDADFYRLRHDPEYVLQPHSIEFQMAAELGIGGVLFLLLFCGSVLSAGFVKRRTIASEDRLIKIAALGIFAAWLAYTSVDWLYDIPGLAGTALVAAALLLVPARSRPSGDSAPIRGSGWGRRIALAAGLCAVAVLAASVGRQYAASRFAASGAGQVARSPLAAISTLHTAERLDPYSVTTLYSISSAYARLDAYPAARDALLDAAKLEPDNYVPPALLGDLAMRRGAYRVARGEYARALELNPGDPYLIQSAEAALRA
jgi:O-Antigen ligase